MIKLYDAPRFAQRAAPGKLPTIEDGDIVMREFLGVTYLLLPLLGGGIFHGLCMKYDWFAFLRRPIDGGWTFRGRPLFGANKTYRGPIGLGLGAGLVLGAQATILHRAPQLRSLELFDYGLVNGWMLGFLVGAVAMLAELPNSFMKRQLGIASGQAGRGILRVVFYVTDQVDVLLGAWVVFALVVDVRFSWVLVSLLLVLVVHQILTTVTYGLGMRVSSR